VGTSVLAPTRFAARMAYAVGRGLSAEERQDIKEAFDLCADVPEGAARGSARALSRHGLTCAMMSLLGYKPATVRKLTVFATVCCPCAALQSCAVLLSLR
jgi:hypothetical protein